MQDAQRIDTGDILHLLHPAEDFLMCLHKLPRGKAAMTQVRTWCGAHELF
jgi:hypothetical protein